MTTLPAGMPGAASSPLSADALPSVESGRPRTPYRADCSLEDCLLAVCAHELAVRDYDGIGWQDLADDLAARVREAIDQLDLGANSLTLGTLANLVSPHDPDAPAPERANGTVCIDIDRAIEGGWLPPREEGL
jgi:hypothetical protein